MSNPGLNNTPPGLNSTSTSYLLWLTGLFGIAGIHRFYNNKPISGVIWLFTWGFFGFGQLVDLFLIPNMVDEHNLKIRAKYGLLPGGMSMGQPTIQVVVPPEAIAAAQSATIKTQEAQPLTKHDIMMKLLRAAQSRQGRLSVTQAVLDTELGFDQVETVLQEMVRTGYVAIENHPESGVVMYNFLEL
jgi:TM2 domain-containing membrane protein YozV/predicted transcriptional regulator